MKSALSSFSAGASNIRLVAVPSVRKLYVYSPGFSFSAAIFCTVMKTAGLCWLCVSFFFFFFFVIQQIQRFSNPTSYESCCELKNHHALSMRVTSTCNISHVKGESCKQILFKGRKERLSSSVKSAPLMSSR